MLGTSVGGRVLLEARRAVLLRSKCRYIRHDF